MLELGGPEGIAVDVQGNTFVVDERNDTVFRVSPTGSITVFIDESGGGSGISMTGPRGVALDASGNTYVSYGSNGPNEVSGVMKIEPTGLVTRIISTTALNRPRGIAVDASQNVYVVGGSSYIGFKIAPDGTLTEFITYNGDLLGNLLEMPVDVAVDLAGNAYVTGYRSDNVFKVAPDGKISQILDYDGDGLGNLCDGPRGIAVDRVGNVYVAAILSDSVFRIAPDGGATVVLDYSGDGSGNLADGPVNVSVDAAGNLYAACTQSDNAFRIDAEAPGEGYCFGDPGSGTPCPCFNDNDGSVPGSGCDNGVYASGAHLTGLGLARVTGDTVKLTTVGLEPQNSGLYFQADNDLSPGVVWGDGLRCAGGSLKRLQVRFADGVGTSSTTVGIAAKTGNISAGDTKYYQCWYRTTVNPPCGSSVNDFNTSNGYAITWQP